MRNTFEDATRRETAEKLHEHGRDMTWKGVEMEATALMKALGSITSNGQCSYSQLFTKQEEIKNQSFVETINSKLKNLPRFTYDSWMFQIMNQFDVCKGMISVYSRTHIQQYSHNP